MAQIKIDPAIASQLIKTLLPMLIENLPGLIMQLIALFAKKPGTPTTPIIEEEPIVSPVPPKEPVPSSIFSSVQLNILDITGTDNPPSIDEALAGNAVGWGSYIRFDSNPKDQFGNPFPGELLGLKKQGNRWVADDLSKSVVSDIEWRSTWDGEGGERPEFAVNIGGNLHTQSNKYSCAVKIFKKGVENAERHVLAVWVRFKLKDGRTIDSNEISLNVD